jgi:hypothetical protein
MLDFITWIFLFDPDNTVVLNLLAIALRLAVLLIPIVAAIRALRSGTTEGEQRPARRDPSVNLDGFPTAPRNPKPGDRTYSAVLPLSYTYQLLNH